MQKRLQLIPLVLLLLCSGTSMSSGLYYSEVKDIIYFIHIVLVMAVFYCARHFIGVRRHRELYSFGVCLAALALCFFSLRKFILPGFRHLYNQISDNAYLTAGIELGQWEAPQIEYAGLAICQIVALITAISLYFFETRKPVAVTLLPSFLVFILPILIDGVPYEVCMIVYGMSFVIFAGMGRYGGNMIKMAFLAGAVFLAGGVAAASFSWGDVAPVIQECRQMIISGGKGVPQQEKDTFTEKKKDNEQTIHFGQFSQVGAIHYNGTVELYVTKLTKFFNKDKLFLRGFVGNTFKDNLWYGPHMEDSYDLRGMVYEREDSIEIENAYDEGNYVAYSTDSGTDWMSINTFVGIPASYKGKFNKKTLKVDGYLRDRIQSEILGDKEFEVVGDAVEFIMDLFKKHYKYTLKPGMIEDDKNEIETFLFERKTGYCTHFASSAVMILRTAGIPARLAQGYMISGYRIDANEKTSVRDSNAHAWVEYYLDQQGWVALDVTPSSIDAGALAGRNPDNGQSPWDEEERETKKPKVTKKPDQADKTQKPGKDKDKDASGKEGDGGRKEPEQKEAPPSESRLVFRMLMAALILAGLLLAGIWLRCLWQYRRIKRILAEENARRKLLCLNDNMRGIWKILGVKWVYTDSKELMRQISQKTQRYYVFGDARELVELQKQIREYVLGVYRCRYSANEISEEEYISYRNYITQLLVNIREQGEEKIWKKIRRQNITKILVKKRGKRKWIKTN